MVEYPEAAADCGAAWRADQARLGPGGGINKLIVNYFSQLLIYRASQELETLIFYSGVTKYDCITR